MCYNLVKINFNKMYFNKTFSVDNVADNIFNSFLLAPWNKFYRTDFIKRIIGLPGEKIKLERGRVYINGKELAREKLEDFVIRDAQGNAERFHQYIETLPEGKQHKIIEVSDYEIVDDMPEVTIPKDSYFVMGDNRNDSNDSRYVAVGAIKKSDMIGKVFVSVKPFRVID